jgi:SAM-dependent methyltransferase
MLAPNKLPGNYRAWNRKQKAPCGSPQWIRLLQSPLAARIAGGRYAWRNRMAFPGWLMRRVGAFSFQLNSLTRTFEYPWCFYATPLSAGMSVVEIGAGAAGFQFVLAKQGLNVTSVDPLINPSESVDWRFSSNDFARVNSAFGGKVRPIRDYLEKAHLEDDSYDRVFAISVLEHVPQEGVVAIMREIHRILKPGGFFIATVDLFLDCHPFTYRLANQWGTNVSVRHLVEESGLALKVGSPRHLNGYPEFDAEEVSRNKSNFLVVNNVMTQCLVLQKDAQAPGKVGSQTERPLDRVEA